MSEISLTLPVPLSVNEIYRAVRKRNILSREAREWIQRVVPMIRDQSNGWYTNKPVAVEYRYHFHDRRRRDICNYEKLLSDCITHAKVWRDDQQVDDARLLRMPVDASCPRVEVRIREL